MMTKNPKSLDASRTLSPQKQRRGTRSSSLLCLGLLVLLSATAAHAEKKCQFDPAWITDPAPLLEVDATAPSDGGLPDSSFCQFYQFSWQNFLYLVSPVDGPEVEQANAYQANFLDQDQFPAFVSGQNPCEGEVPRHTFFRSMPTSPKPRLLRSVDHSGPDTGPDIYQAGSNAVIYDQSHQAAIYSMRFSRNMCNLEEVLPKNYFPAGTTELKMAWKILGKNEDASLYYTVQAPKGALSVNGGETLGLIGFHIAIATKAHPEMIWITLEHKLNNPLCGNEKRFDPKPIRSHAWSFTSKECAEELAKCAVGPQKCPEVLAACPDLNEPEIYEDKNAEETGKPTEICQVYPYGQLPDSSKPNDPYANPRDNDNEANEAAIKTLDQGFIDNFESVDWAKIWTNYRMVGALWLSQPYLAPVNGNFNSTEGYERGNPGDGTHQRGSLALANSVAETDFQGPVEKEVTLDDGSEGSALRNCFGCHGFTTNSTKMLRPISALEYPNADAKVEKQLSPGTGTISHIMGKIVQARCEKAQMFLPGSRSGLTHEDPNQVANLCQDACSSSGEAFPVWSGKFFNNSAGLQCLCCTGKG